MSGTDAKRKSGSGRREARALQEKKEKRKVRVTSITVFAVLILLFLGALLINSKYLRRIATAVTINGVKFSATEFDYFYQNAVFEFSNYLSEQMGDAASSYMPSNDRPHSSQIKDEETGETWAQFFGKMALQQMAELVSYRNEAVSNGYKLSDETLSSIDDEITNMKYTAELYSSSFKTFDSFLQGFYGTSINEKAFRQIAEFMHLAGDYTNYVRDSFSYAASELEQYYDENKDSLDVFAYRYITIYKQTTSEEDYDSTEEYEASKDAALADAFVLAQEIADGIASEEDLIAAAKEYDAASYTEDDSTLRNYPGEWLGGVYGDWLKDSARVEGDVSAFEMSNGAYVVYYISRNNNRYALANMRQIFIKRDDVDEEEYKDYDVDFSDDDLLSGLDYENAYYYDEEGYAAALEAAETAAKERADEVYAVFKEGGATEEQLISMVTEYSDDTAAEGGLYENIYKNTSSATTEPEVEAWLFDPARQLGDYELINTAAKGYYLVFFTGFGERYCDYLADTRMRDRDFNAWKDALAEPADKQSWAMRLTESHGKFEMVWQ